MESRVREIERRLEDMGRRMRAVESRAARAEQLANQMASMLGRGNGGDGGVGSYFADPGEVVIASGGSQDLVVMEVLASGPMEVGERTVVNPFAVETLADERLMLTRNRDGSYTVMNQDCPPEPEEEPVP